MLVALGRYLPPTLGVLLAGGLVAAGVLVSEGSRAADSMHRSFQLRRDANLVTLVPQNWQGGHVPGPAHVTREVFIDPDRTAYSMTIEMQRNAMDAAGTRARLKLAELRRRAGFRLRFYGRVRLPGGRVAWLIEYTVVGVAHAVYLYSGCAPTVAMSVDVSAPTRADLAGPLSQLAFATGPLC